MRKAFEIGGVVAATVLIAFGVAAIVMGVNGRFDRPEQPQAGEDRRLARHDPGSNQGRGQEGGLDVADISFPSLAVAGKAINSGDQARAFAGYMRVHALEATGGLTYAEMGRFMAKPGPPHSSPTDTERRATRSTRSIDSRPSSRSRTAPGTSG